MLMVWGRKINGWNMTGMIMDDENIASNFLFHTKVFNWISEVWNLISRRKLELKEEE